MSSPWEAGQKAQAAQEIEDDLLLREALSAALKCINRSGHPPWNGIRTSAAVMAATVKVCGKLNAAQKAAFWDMVEDFSK